MARVKFSGLIDTINGSINGTTFQRNAYGSTVKGKPIMVNPNTILQQQRKYTMQSITNKWKDLTTAQRNAWDTYATTYPVASRLNPDSYLNGYNYFLRWHGIAELYNSTLILPDPSGAQGTVTDYSVGASNVAGSLFTLASIQITGSTWRILFYASGRVTASQVFSKSILRYMTSLVAVNDDNEVDLTPFWTPKFGAVPPVGGYIFVQNVLQKSNNGQVIFFPPQRVQIG